MYKRSRARRCIMRKVRLIPILLALSMPLTACDIFNPQGQHQKQDVTEIVKVSAPSTIEQNKTLAPSKVKLTVKYKDNKTEVVKADRIILNTATVGKTTGTAFYGNVFKDFSITVVSSAVTVTSIDSVIAPETVAQNQELLVSDVTLNVTYSDGSHGTETPSSVEFDSSTLGEASGVAHLGNLSASFTSVVVANRTFIELRNDVNTNHNYTLDITSYYVNFQDERYDGHMYNISNKAYFGTDPEYKNFWDSGFIKVKDQGIAKFYWSIVNQEVILDTFVASNADRTIYDIESCLVEFLLESPSLTQVTENHYECGDQELIGMIANFSGLELTYISNPAKIDVTKVGNSLKIEGTYSSTYLDPETSDPVLNQPIYLGVTIKNIGSTVNQEIESFVEDPSKKVPDVTEWDEECLDAFDEHYNEYVPPFPTGASYSFFGFYKWDGYEQKNYIKCQDIAAGDLTSSYAAQLVGQDYALEGDGVYRKRVQNEQHTLEHIYEAKLTYYAESEPYSDHTYGYYYAGGVFQIQFCYYTQMVEAVSDIESLNYYISTTEAASIVPVFPEAFNSSTVTKFDDRTEAVNQQYPDSVIFTTSSTSMFRIYIPSYDDAVTFYNELISRCEAKGFDNISHGQGLFAGLTTAMDYADSKIVITDMDNKTKTDYEAKGYLECQIYIRNNYTLYHSVTLEKDDGVSNAHITSPANYMKVEEGTKVTFSVTIADGYALDEITSNVVGVEITEESAGVYSFLMPASNITVNVISKSTAGDEGLVFDKEYTVYMGYSDSQPYYERPTTQSSIKLHFVFKSDGSGSFNYVRYNSSGTVVAGPYKVEFIYTLISGSFLITCSDETKAGDNAVFGKYRLFTSATTGNYNETGVFNNNEITITLSNGSSTTTEVTLK